MNQYEPLRQREVERRPLLHLALRPDAAAVAMDDALHRGQADPAFSVPGTPYLT